MNCRLSRVLALVSVLAISSLALAQDGETATFNIASFAAILGPVAAIIWLILFAAWGGFRWFY